MAAVAGAPGSPRPTRACREVSVRLQNPAWPGSACTQGDRPQASAHRDFRLPDRAGIGAGAGREVPRRTDLQNRIRGNATITNDKIKPKLLSRVGQPLDRDRVEADPEDLDGDEVVLRCQVLPWRVASQEWQVGLDLRGAEMPLLTKSRIQRAEGHPLEGDRGYDRVEGRQSRWDPMRTRLAVSQIQHLYVEKGCDLASVTLLEGGNTGGTKIVIRRFSRGQRSRSAASASWGNQFASDAQLRIKIATPWPSWGSSASIHSEMLDEDRQKLIGYYQSQELFRDEGDSGDPARPPSRVRSTSRS